MQKFSTFVKTILNVDILKIKNTITLEIIVIQVETEVLHIEYAI